MIVDDEVAVLEKVKSYLKSDEIEVVTANNSRQALKLMEKKPFDLILVDTPMPGGKKAALYLMRADSNLAAEVENSLLQKPFTKDQLVSLVKNII